MAVSFSKPALITIALAVLVIGLYGIYTWTANVNKQAAYIGLAGGTSRLLPRVGCPVLFTDAPEFRGAHRCFELGSISDLELEGNGIAPDDEALSSSLGAARKMTGKKVPSSFDGGAVMSVGVRPGYTVVAYSEPDFRGEVVLNRTGPSEKSYRGVTTEPLSLSCNNRMEAVRKGLLIERLKKEAKIRAPKPRSLQVRLST